MSSCCYTFKMMMFVVSFSIRRITSNLIIIASITDFYHEKSGFLNVLYEISVHVSFLQIFYSIEQRASRMDGNHFNNLTSIYNAIANLFLFEFMNANISYMKGIFLMNLTQPEVMSSTYGIISQGLLPLTPQPHNHNNHSQSASKSLNEYDQHCICVSKKEGHNKRKRGRSSSVWIL